MGEILAYSLSSALMLACMYLIYKWMLAGENQHSYNRLLLWGIYAVALSMPVLMPQIADLFKQGQAAAPQQGMIALELPEISLAEPSQGGATLPAIILALYLLGVTVVAGYTAMVGWRLWRVISSGEKIRHGNYTLVLIDNNDIAPFSWLHFIVMNRNDYSASGHVITLHESRHLAARHWIDLLFAQLVCILQWFNPAAWLMREELKTVHEYQADAAVLASGTDARQYQMLLIKKAVGARFPSLANSLNHSKLKKRVTMMYKSKTSTGRRLRALALIPAGALALFVTNIPAVASALADASAAELSLPESKVSENVANGQPATPTVISLVATPAEATPDTTPAQKTERIETVQTSEGVMTIKVDSSKELGGSPDIYVNGEKLASSDELTTIPSDRIESMRVDKSGKTTVIYITLRDANAPKSEASEKAPVKLAQNGAYTAVEEMPKFPGGESEMLNFIATHMVYPKEAMDAGIDGRVIVKFIVGSDGKVRDVNVLRGKHAALDAEACRVVALLPDFIPGKVDGKAVDCNYVLPVSFKLTGDPDPAPAAEQGK